MKTVIVSLCVLFLALCSNTYAVDDEIGVTSGQIVVMDLVLNSVVNLYGTNQVIVDSYGNGGIAQKEALAAVQRNKDFLKVLTKYTMDIKRQSAKGDKKTIAFLNKMAEVCTALDLHLSSIVMYIEKNDKASVDQLEKNREKVETLINELVTSDLSG